MEYIEAYDFSGCAFMKETLLSGFIRDLFDACATVNDGSADARRCPIEVDTGGARFTVEQRLRLLLPEEFSRGQSTSELSALAAHSAGYASATRRAGKAQAREAADGRIPKSNGNRNYAIGRLVAAQYDSHPQTTIQKFEKRAAHCLKLKETDGVRLTVNRNCLESYLRAIKGRVLCFADEDSAVSEAYDHYLENHETARLLGRVILLLILSAPPKSRREEVPLADGIVETRSTFIRQYNPVKYLDAVILPVTGTDVMKATSFFRLNTESTALLIRKEILSGNTERAFTYTLHILKLMEKDKKQIDASPAASQLAGEIRMLFAEQILKDWVSPEFREDTEAYQKRYKTVVDMLTKHYCDYPPLSLLLYKIYKGIYKVEGYSDDSASEFYLKYAVSEHLIEAVLIQWEEQLGSAETAGMDEKLARALAKSEKELARQSARFTKNELARYNYNLARYRYLTGDKVGSREALEAATACGHETARKLLKRLDAKPRKINEFSVADRPAESEKICILNDFSSEAKVFLSSLPEDYTVWHIGNRHFLNFGQSVERAYYSIGDCIDALRRIVLPDGAVNANARVIFAFFSPEKEHNVDTALKVLDYLYNMVVENDLFSRADFIGIFDIFLKARDSNASVLLDASISEMGEEVFFKTHICDTALLAVRELLARVPLFAPQVPEQHTLVFGRTPLCKAFIKEAIAVGYMGNACRLSITQLNDAPEESRDELQNEIPELNNKLALNSTIDVSFVGCRAPLLPKRAVHDKERDARTENSEQEKKYAEMLDVADYIVVDIGNDMENISFAIQLRRWYARHYIALRKSPIIAVYCQSPSNAYWSQRMTLDNFRQGNAWNNAYRLRLFGGLESLYSYKALIHSEGQRLALSIHCAYCGTDSSDFSTLNSYYSFSYNRDSSFVTGLGLRYRLYAAGCYTPAEAESVPPFAVTEAVAERYEAWLKDNMRYALEIEQGRWNNYMVSRGWSGVTLAQLNEYLNFPEQDNHKFVLAKLHPYLANYDELSDDGSIFQAVSLFYQRFGKRVTPPQTATKESVRKTTEWLRFILSENLLENGNVLSE